MKTDNAKGLFGCCMFYLKIPRYIRGDTVNLRRLHIFDGPFMSKALRDEDILKSNGLTQLGFKSWFSLWWWFKKTYCYLYCIEAYSRRIGFIGLHNPNPDRSVEVSLVIFKKEDRRHGYGTRAFSMLEQTIRQSRYFKKVIVKIRGDNNTSISFWSKLGFKKTDNYGGLIVMLQTLY